MTAVRPAFEVLEIVAGGTFGTVCVAHDLRAGSVLALKVLKGAHVHRPRILARTRDEAEILQRLHHPAIVQVHGLLEIGKRPVVVMEWVRGLSLSQLQAMRERPMPAAVAVQLVRTAAEALDAAWEARPPDGGPPMRIIHRDIKPSNLLLSVDGQLKLVDFGIAKAEMSGRQSETLSMVLGARGYLAPERLDGHDDLPAVDTYALGVTLFELLQYDHLVMSVHPSHHEEMLAERLEGLEPEGIAAPAVEELRALIARMCCYTEQKRPSHREVADVLAGFLARYELEPNVERFARAEVLPRFVQRPRMPPVDHPEWSDLAFLQRTAADASNPPEPDVNEELRKRLAQPDWYRRFDELEVLLAMHPHWSPQPFLDMLGDGRARWWKFWEQRPHPEALRTALQLLAGKPSPPVREHARAYLEHTHEGVRRAARDVLTRRR